MEKNHTPDPPTVGDESSDAQWGLGRVKESVSVSHSVVSDSSQPHGL